MKQTLRFFCLMVLMAVLSATVSRAADATTEKLLYSTRFGKSDGWTASSTAFTTYSFATKYSHETITFTGVGSTIQDETTYSEWDSRFTIDWTSAARAEKSKKATITTSPLRSVSKVQFKHGATGSKRGWGLKVKGDGDADWVTLSDAVATNAKCTEVEVAVNRTNAQLQFYNLDDAQNAYLFELAIYGNVDMSSRPALGSFTLNGKQYAAVDIFAEDADGNMVATIEIPKAQAMPSAQNPLADIVCENGTVESVTYGDKRVDMQVKAGDQTVSYVILTPSMPDYTLTYYIDGKVYATQTVEKGSPIGELKLYTELLSVSEEFRGWFAKPDGEYAYKYTAADIVTGNISLYGRITPYEGLSSDARNTYKLNEKYFYPEDHEAISFEGGSYHDATHGWVFKAGDKLHLRVAGNANIFFGLCQYSKGNKLTVTTANGTVVKTLNDKADKDGQQTVVAYTGEPGELIVTFGGETYLHSVTIANTLEPVTNAANGYFTVKAGSVGSLLNCIDAANAQPGTGRVFIYVPAGTYDLGETTYTTISRNNVSLVGEGIGKTIIRNAPLPENEGIGKTATLAITASGTYLQDLTLWNDMKFTGSTGRAVALHDTGNRTICKNVCLQSYQDTYYSNNSSACYYFEGGEIHGVVDYVCGGGDVFFEGVKFVNEAIKDATIAAPNGAKKFGYVMNNCTIETLCSKFNLGRSWGSYSGLAWLNTTVNQPSRLATSRFTTAGMNCAADSFKEYNTRDTKGTLLTPQSNVVKFTHSTGDKQYETVLTASQAAGYALSTVFPDWSPAALTAQAEVTAAIIDTEGNITCSATPAATAFALYKDGVFEQIVSGSTATVADPAAHWTVRAANASGGFGPAVEVLPEAVSVSAPEASAHKAVKATYNMAGQRVDSSAGGIRLQVYTDGTACKVMP